MTEPSPSPIWGHLEPEKVIRRDNLGETWRALDRQSGAKVDLRILPDWVDRAALELFTERLKPLAHPALIPTLGFMANEKQSAVILDFCDGETIAQRRARRPRRHFEVSEIKPWLRVVVDVLDYLHRNSLTHGAIYLGSFLLEGASLRLTDLAVSRLLRPQAQFDGGALLPPTVMSPQMMAGADPSPVDDIYSLAALIYDLLTGQPVFHSGDIASQVTGAVPPSVEARRRELEVTASPIPEEWQAWLSAALSKDPTKRPSLETLAALVRAGVPANAPASTIAPAVSPKPITSPALKKPSFSHNQLVIGSTIAICAVIFLSLYLFKIAPRSSFKKQLNADYAAALEYDHQNPDDHRKVLARWSDFQGKWATQVQTKYPGLASVLASADEQRHLRETRQRQQEEDAAERLRGHVAQARAEFISAKAAINLAGPKDRAAALATWEKFLATYDKPFEEQSVPTDLATELTEARTGRDQLKSTLEAEKKQAEDFLATATSDLEKVRAAAVDPALPSATKLASAQDLLAKIAKAPVAILSDPQTTEIQKTVNELLPNLQEQASKETPTGPLDLQALFANSPYKDFTENGKKHLLKNVQATLKGLAFYKGTPDGTTGQGTHDAILAFQKSKNLVPSAALDERTLTELGLTGIAEILTPFNDGDDDQPTKRRPRKPKEKPPEKNIFQKTGDSIKNLFKSGS